MSEPAAGYTRLSQDGISIEKQKASIRDYCRNHDLNLTTIYDDGQHASGYSVDERPESQALREIVRNRDVAAIALRDMGRQVLTEASGDITVATVPHDDAATGVDVISMGSLTHSGGILEYSVQTG